MKSPEPKEGYNAEEKRSGEEILFVRLFGCAALRTITADFQPGDHNMEPAIALNLSLQAIEEVAFKFRNLAAAQTCHVDVIPLGTALVVVLLALHMHEVKFIDQTVPLQQAKRAIYGDPVDLRIEAASAPQQLAGIKVLFGGFDDAQDGAPLTGHAQSARHQLGLETSWNLGLR
jgi:hypothetical protein